MTGAVTPTPQGDFLQRMATSSRARCDAARKTISEAALVERLKDVAGPISLHLSDTGFDLIAEVKKSSPSAGQLATGSLDPSTQARAYAAAGAAAISVLTEPDSFSGSLDDLTNVVTAVEGVPVMRKDFLVDPYQVVEARAAGAGGVLLIAAILNDEQLRDLLHATLELGMFALVEAFDAKDLTRCVPVMQDVGSATESERTRMLVGINCRNLRSLEVEFGRFAVLADELPDNIAWVAESGIASAEDAAKIAALGYRAALVGTALMRAADPVAQAQVLLAAGRG